MNFVKKKFYTKIFSSKNHSELEKELNQFLHNIHETNLLDVKFSTSSGGEFSAMVLYMKL